jgi:signal transduction histidine kinase
MRRSVWRSVLNLIPHGYGLEEADWQRRHRLLLFVLALHVPGLAAAGVALGRPPDAVLAATVVPAACVLVGRLLRRRRRVAAVTVTAGLVYSSAALVGLTGGTIEAHFHFFVIIGFIALYQDWVPFLTNVAFTVLSHGVGSAWQESLMFNHAAGRANPWLWSLIHGVAVLVACVGMAVFWRITEDSQREKDDLARRLADAELNRRRFTSELLVNLARRNQSMLYRQLEIINQLEASEQDPEALADLFTLDHLATRVQRNAESLLVLSGEQPARVWHEPVALRDVVRAAIAETEDFERVSVQIDDRPRIAGASVTDVTHLLAELTENAVRYSPPDTTVRIRLGADRYRLGGQVIVIEDRGVGMPADDLAAANMILSAPVDVDLSVAQRLGFHVVSRLSARHGIRVYLSPTPGSGITAVVALPSELFEHGPDASGSDADQGALAAAGAPTPAGAAVPARSGGGAHRLRPDTETTGPDLGAVVPGQRSAPTWFSQNAGPDTGPGTGSDTGQSLGLSRRVPQSHLVPQLRHDGAALPTAHVAGPAQVISRLRAAADRGGDGPGTLLEPAAPDPGPPDTDWFEPGGGR